MLFAESWHVRELLKCFAVSPSGISPSVLFVVVSYFVLTLKTLCVRHNKDYTFIVEEKHERVFKQEK